ncbi:MAG: cystathionine beta-lyase [Caulobacter sp.]|nr:cystathionine beta-lyase [Caulobacter sp.]
MHEKTRLIHAGRTPETLARTVGPPIQRGSTVLLPNSQALYEDDLGYGRSGLAAQAALIEALAELEGAAAVQLYPSGLAALTGALLAVLKAGDSVLLSEGAYKPTRQFCQNVLQRFGVRVQLHDARLSAQEVLALIADDTRLILLESPSSLTFEMQDVPAIAAGARARGVLTLIDNTWAAGLYFKPLAHGVDISVQALTKYVCGHSDIFMGSAATGDAALGALLEAGVHDLGWAVTGEAAYDMLRGLRTLPTRLARHDQSARAIAGWLADQPQVLKVLHPALPDDPGHAIWRRDYSGASGLFGVVMKPGPLKAQHAFLDALKLFGLGFSWGGFESLAIRCDPQLASRRFVKALEGPLMRLHIGLEDEADLIADLAGALAAYEAASD